MKQYTFPKEELMTAEETALYFKKSIDTIANWVKKGYIQKYGVGDAVYFKRNEIEKFSSSNK
jgi:hypothetical protein